MHAVVIDAPGESDVLRWREVPDPEPGPGEVLIEVAAAGVNRADLLQRRGFYSPPPGASPYPGLECSGVVIARGDGVTQWELGDRVCALLVGGGYAERVVVPQGQLLPVPDGMPLIEAAALPEAVCTVWSNVFMLAGLRSDETLLIHGGTSGIGTMAIQLAHDLGARVIITSGTPEKVASALSFGADYGIDYRTEDFVERVHDITDGHGADVILDVIGAKYLARNLEALAYNGRLVIIGLQGGTKAELNLNTLLTKRGAILATSLRGRPDEEKAAIVASVRAHVWPLIEAGSIEPVVDRVLPITEAARAHDVIEAGAHVGKVVLSLGEIGV